MVGEKHFASFKGMGKKVLWVLVLLRMSSVTEEFENVRLKVNDEIHIRNLCFWSYLCFIDRYKVKSVWFGNMPIANPSVFLFSPYLCCIFLILRDDSYPFFMYWEMAVLIEGSWFTFNFILCFEIHFEISVRVTLYY